MLQNHNDAIYRIENNEFELNKVIEKINFGTPLESCVTNIGQIKTLKCWQGIHIDIREKLLRNCHKNNTSVQKKNN